MFRIPFHYFCTFLFSDEPDEFDIDTTDSRKSPILKKYPKHGLIMMKGCSCQGKFK